MLHHATYYTALTWLHGERSPIPWPVSVIPCCYPVRWERSGCTAPRHAQRQDHTPGKAPLVRWAEYQEHLPTEAEWAEWDTTFRGAYNLAAVTGAISRIVVLDLDCHPGGADGRETLRRYGLEVPPTLTVTTPSGGLHAYFRYPEGVGRLRNFRGDLPGVDARADGGIVVLPPGHTHAGSYTLATAAPPAEVPDWLLALLQPPKPTPGRSPATEDLDDWAALWEGPHLPGDRHPAAVRLAGHLLGHGLEADEVLAALLLWNDSACDPPKDESEIERIVYDLAEKDEAESVTGTADALVELPPAVQGLLMSPDAQKRRAGAVRAARLGVPAVAIAPVLEQAGEDDPHGVAAWAVRAATRKQSLFGR